jgi:hypothetical protein
MQSGLDEINILKATTNNSTAENSVGKARKLVLRCYNSPASQQELSVVQVATYIITLAISMLVMYWSISFSYLSSVISRMSMTKSNLPFLLLPQVTNITAISLVWVGCVRVMGGWLEDILIALSLSFSLTLTHQRSPTYKIKNHVD